MSCPTSLMSALVNLLTASVHDQTSIYDSFKARWFGLYVAATLKRMLGMPFLVFSDRLSMNTPRGVPILVGIRAAERLHCSERS